MGSDMGSVLYSATDLVNFLGCVHYTTLATQPLGLSRTGERHDPYLKLLQEKGIAHERAYLAELGRTRYTVVCNSRLAIVSGLARLIP